MEVLRDEKCPLPTTYAKFRRYAMKNNGDIYYLMIIRPRCWKLYTSHQRTEAGTLQRYFCSERDRIIYIRNVLIVHKSHSHPGIYSDYYRKEKGYLTKARYHHSTRIKCGKSIRLGGRIVVNCGETPIHSLQPCQYHTWRCCPFAKLYEEEMLNPKST